MTALPMGWTLETLSDVAAWGSGGTPQAGDAALYGGDIPWAVIGDLNEATVMETRASITDAGLVESSAKLVPEGAVLLAMYGSIGKLGIAGRPMATNQAIAFALPNERVLGKYLFYYLMSQRHQLDAMGKGATQRNISQTILRPWPIPLPEGLAEQQRIVDILEDHLSRLGAAESGIAFSVARLASLKERVLSAGLLGETTPGPRKPIDLTDCGTDDGQLSDLPLGWTWRRLGDIATVAGGVTKDAKRQSDPAFVEVPYLRVANVQRGWLDLGKITNIRVPASKAKALRLLPGDVLMNEGGDRDKLARGWVWEGQVESCIHQNHVFRARILDEAIDPKLLSWAGNTIGGRWAERNGKQSVNLASISLTKIRQMPIPVPLKAVQPELVKELEDRLEACDRLTASLQEALARSATLRRSLLASAFSGLLTGRSTDMEIVEEIASV